MKKMIAYYISILVIDVILMAISIISLSFSAMIGAFLALTFSAISFVLAFRKEKHVGRIGSQILFLARIIAFPIIYYAIPLEIVNSIFIYIGSIVFLISSLMLLIPISSFKNEEEDLNKYRVIKLVLFIISSIVAVGFIIGSFIYTFRTRFDWMTSLLPLICVAGVLLCLLIYSFYNKRDVYLGVFLASLLVGQAITFTGLLIDDYNEVFMHFFAYDYLIIAMPFMWLALLLLPSLKKKVNAENN